jgi:K+-sensing histidine kinase KdpD
MPSSQTGSLARAGITTDDAAQKSSVKVPLLRTADVRSVSIRYGNAALLATAALIASLGLQHLFAFPYPFLFLFFGAVMVSAWVGGMGAGLFAVLLSTLFVDYFFVPPFYSWQISATAETYFVSFVVCALVASWISSAKKRSEEAFATGARPARNQSVRTQRRSDADPGGTCSPFAYSEHG